MPTNYYCRQRIINNFWACPVHVLALTENFSYAPINVGTAHISHSTVYIKRCRAASVDPFLSAIAGTSQLLRLSTTVVLDLLFASKLPEEPVIKSMGFYFIYGFDCYIKAPME